MRKVSWYFKLYGVGLKKSNFHITVSATARFRAWPKLWVINALGSSLSIWLAAPFSPPHICICSTIIERTPASVMRSITSFNTWTRLSALTESTACRPMRFSCASFFHQCCESKWQLAPCWRHLSLTAMQKNCEFLMELATCNHIIAMISYSKFVDLSIISLPLQILQILGSSSTQS